MSKVCETIVKREPLDRDRVNENRHRDLDRCQDQELAHLCSPSLGHRTTTKARYEGLRRRAHNLRERAAALLGALSHARGAAIPPARRLAAPRACGGTAGGFCPEAHP